MVLGEDYKFRDDLLTESKEETVPIELLYEMYKGVVYRYTVVRVAEAPSDKSSDAILHYDFDILQTPKHLKEDTLKKDDFFQKVVQNILQSLIFEAVGQKVEA